MDKKDKKENKENKEKKEKKENKENKEKKKEIGLNTVNNEQVTKPIKDAEIKKDIINIEFDDFFVKKNDLSLLITGEFGEKTEKLKNTVILYFYSEKFENSDAFTLNNLLYYQISFYISNLKKKLKTALNIPKVIKGFRENIAYLDGVRDENILKTLPRYQKLKRLEGLYDTLIKMGLTLIHNYYWTDICNNETSDDYSLEECIKRASPTIIKMKHDFEDIVKSEFEYDDTEEKLILMHRKY